MRIPLLLGGLLAATCAMGSTPTTFIPSCPSPLLPRTASCTSRGLALKRQSLGPPAFPRAMGRPLGLRRAARSVGPVMQLLDHSDEDEFSVKVRLVMLRSPIVQWYNGPDKMADDEEQILREFKYFVNEHERWQMNDANATGVYATNPSPDGVVERDVRVQLLGVGGWRHMQMIRDSSYPNEPYMEFVVSQKDYDPAAGLVYGTCEDFVGWAKRFSGMSWTSMDLPVSGFGGVMDGEDPSLDQGTVVPPTSCASVQKAIPDEDRPFFDTSALTDWLIPELKVQFDDDDLGVAGTTPVDGREYDMMDMGIMATEGRVTAEERAKYEAGGVYGKDPLSVAAPKKDEEGVWGSAYDFVDEDERDARLGAIDVKGKEAPTRRSLITGDEDDEDEDEDDEDEE